jgi:hypothetical protein
MWPELRYAARMLRPAAHLQPHGCPDACPRDWGDDSHVQRGQRSGDQAPSLSRIRERRNDRRLGSIWNRAYARLPAGAPDVCVVRGKWPHRSRSSVCTDRPRRRFQGRGARSARTRCR